MPSLKSRRHFLFIPIALGFCPRGVRGLTLLAVSLMSRVSRSRGFRYFSAIGFSIMQSFAGISPIKASKCIKKAV